MRKAKILAVQRNVSLSSLLTQALEDLVVHEAEFTLAHTRHLSWLEKGADLGTLGGISWKREELHER